MKCPGNSLAKKAFLLLFLLPLFCGLSACAGKRGKTIQYWRADSPSMASILSLVTSVTDENSAEYLPPEQRIAVFDLDGTLYGELFPTYFDECLLLHRLLHDKDYQPAAEDRAWAQDAETALLTGEPEPNSPRSSAQMAAEAFQGFTVEEYRTYVREFMDQTVVGFTGMRYGEGFYLPMIELVRYLSEHGFTVLLTVVPSVHLYGN